jgi:hypothetical protein
MKIKLLDNAVDSLSMAIDFFYEWCEEDNDRYLKLTIISFHNAFELLLKSILINENELLIYENLSDKEILEGLKIRKQLENTVSLDEILIKNMNVKTINYSALIKLYCSIFDCNERTKKILEKLGALRNAISHFGIDKSDSFLEVINTIYESMKIILNVLYPQLLDIHDTFSYSHIIDALEDFIESGQQYQKELGLKNSDTKMRKFAEIFKQVIIGDTFKVFLEKNKLEMDIRVFDIDSFDFSIEFHNDNGQYIMGMYDYYCGFANTTLFTDESGELYLVVDHASDNFFYYHEECTYNFKNEDYKQWEKDYKEKKCAKKNLTFNNLKKALEFLLCNKTNISTDSD